MRLGLLMRKMALDWTLSSIQRVDFGATLQTWEHYANDGRLWDLYILGKLMGKKESSDCSLLSLQMHD